MDKDKIKKLIINNNIEEAITDLLNNNKQNLNNPYIKTELETLLTSYKSLKSQKRLNLIGHEEAGRESARIVNSLLELVNIDLQDEKLEIQKNNYVYKQRDFQSSYFQGILKPLGVSFLSSLVIYLIIGNIVLSGLLGVLVGILLSVYLSD